MADTGTPLASVDPRMTERLLGSEREKEKERQGGELSKARGESCGFCHDQCGTANNRCQGREAANGGRKEVGGGEVQSTEEVDVEEADG